MSKSIKYNANWIDMSKNPNYHSIMENLSFLPDGLPVSAFILAQLPYDREKVESIISGSSPQKFSSSTNTRTTWGLLYIRSSEIGFFVHASETPMAAVFRSAGNGAKLRELHLSLDSGIITKAEIRNPEKPKHWFSKILDCISLQKDELVDLSWNINDEEFSLTFLCNKIPSEFKQAIENIKL